MHLVITTVSRPDPDQVERAQLVARRCDVPFVPRQGSLRAVLEAADIAYVVGRDRDELRSTHHRLSVHQGLLSARLSSGRDHPLIRALAPGPPPARIVDGTLGLAADALHIAATLGCQVVGFEASPVVYSLVEEGLERLGRELSAARRIDARLGDAVPLLEALSPASVDAVYLSPMSDRPHRAAPGFELLRAVARHDPFDEPWLEAALRVARERVVLKAPPGWAPPTRSPDERIRGKAVDYLVFASSHRAQGSAGARSSSSRRRLR